MHPLPYDDGRQSRPHCRNCGNRVSHQFARVFGDNRDALLACPNCASVSELPRLVSGTADAAPIADE